MPKLKMDLPTEGAGAQMRFVLLAQEKLRRLHNAKGELVRDSHSSQEGLGAFRHWQKHWFRARNSVVGRAHVAVRGLAPPAGVAWEQMKEQIRALPVGHPAFDQVDLDTAFIPSA